MVFKESGENFHVTSCPLSPVALPAQNATRSFWLASPEDNPLAEEGGKGELTENAEVCIVGSGITGVSVAWHLSQTMKEYKSKTNVVILEAREFCEHDLMKNLSILEFILCRFWCHRYCVFVLSNAQRISN